ncbi:MAG: lipoate--protein ligase [Syntrophomonadaceae bacterium]|nr:lipoate--protein ligase [Syntrophomonadaceae bacterium]
MIYIDNPATDPTWNLALEEYLLSRKAELGDILLLWRNEPSVIIGRHQNAMEEVNTEYVREHGIRVVRRPSGGGAVYHDLGNVNFSFIVHDSGVMLNFQRFTAPVIAALRAMGADARDEGRNDISIDGRKVSGNAQYRQQGRVLHHGTLLFATDLAAMEQALSVSGDKLQSRAVSSVRSRVANISEFVDSAIDVLQFRDILLQSIAGPDCKRYVLTLRDKDAIAALRDEKYRRFTWNVGQSPPFELRRRRRFDWGTLDIRLNVRRGTISEIRFYGDYFSIGEPDALAARLTGADYEAESLAAIISEAEVKTCFPQLTKAEFLSLLLNLDQGGEPETGGGGDTNPTVKEEKEGDI